MKAAIHPAYKEVRVHCACGNTFTTRSTHKGNISLEICSNCHPFFTGKQKLVDTAGRVERFRRKYAKAGEAAKKEGSEFQGGSARGEAFLLKRLTMHKFWENPAGVASVPAGTRIPESLQLGTARIAPATILAPMAGVTDTVFRRFIRNASFLRSVRDVMAPPPA